MVVRYEDGSEATLKVGMQERIWQNISAEEEAQEAVRRAKAAKKKSSSRDTRFLIKIVSSPTDDFTFPGWQEKVAIILSDSAERPQHSGDRLIYYAMETQSFVAVATITGESFTANLKKYTYTLAQKEAEFFSVDPDTTVPKPSLGVLLENIELESRPDLSKLPLHPELYVLINEDDFEMLAEALAEISEDDELIDDDDEDIEVDEDE
ncbi:MAG: hypothetical protein AAF614_24330 [Chloroflexota bacterium]